MKTVLKNTLLYNDEVFLKLLPVEDTVMLDKKLSMTKPVKAHSLPEQARETIGGTNVFWRHQAYWLHLVMAYFVSQCTS